MLWRGGTPPPVREMYVRLVAIQVGFWVSSGTLKKLSASAFFFYELGTKSLLNVRSQFEKYRNKEGKQLN